MHILQVPKAFTTVFEEDTKYSEGRKKKFHSEPNTLELEEINEKKL